VLVHEGVDIDKQIYLAFLHDRKNQGLVCVYSTKGGMDIEEVAK
jgi:succinyl-CoA synthetase beta subunit